MQSNSQPAQLAGSKSPKKLTNPLIFKVGGSSTSGKNVNPLDEKEEVGGSYFQRQNTGMPHQ